MRSLLPFLLLIWCSHAAATPATRADRQVARAERLWAVQNYSKAQDLVERVLQAFPDHRQAHALGVQIERERITRLELAASRTDDPRVASTARARIVEATTALVRHARAVGPGDMDGAIAARVLVRHEGRPLTGPGWPTCSLEARRTAEEADRTFLARNPTGAESLWHIALDACDYPAWWARLAEVQAARGETHHARQSAMEAVQRSPCLPAALRVLVHVDPDHAGDHTVRALACDPSDAATWRLWPLGLTGDAPRFRDPTTLPDPRTLRALAARTPAAEGVLAARVTAVRNLIEDDEGLDTPWLRHLRAADRAGQLPEAVLLTSLDAAVLPDLVRVRDDWVDRLASYLIAFHRAQDGDP